MGADEALTVLAFIAALGSLSPNLDESLAKVTLRWLASQGMAVQQPGEPLPEGPAQRALDTLLLAVAADSAERRASASAPA